MKKTTLYVAVLILFSLGVSAQEPYKDPKLSAEQRAGDLLKRLTLEEKVSLMQNSSPAIPRLGVKPYDWWSEALHGIARNGNATVFPQTIGMAASFDAALLFNVFDAASDEARVKYRQASLQNKFGRYQGLTVWTPNINIFRDPRWGRGQETYGEDPFLTSVMGQAVVRGLQGIPKKGYDKLHACAKHFAVHSGPESTRHKFNAENISPRDLWETYLPAFKDLVQKADVKEIMCAYNRYEGEPCCGSNRLLTQILRDEWRYKHLVVTDCGAVSDFFRPWGHKVDPDAAHASSKAVLNGTDLECGSDLADLVPAVSQGLIKEDRINTSVKRLLIARFALGEMDDPSLVPWMQIKDNVLCSPAHQHLALDMARESMTLLLNKNHILPLSKNMKILVIGPNAVDSVTLWGNYNGFPLHTETILDGIEKKIPSSSLVYDEGCSYTQAYSLHSLFNECTLNGKAGFKAEYFNNLDLKGEPVSSEWLTSPFNFSTFGGTAFAPGLSGRNFSALFTSRFTPSKSGDVAFRVSLSGEYSLIINGEEVKTGNGMEGQQYTVYVLKAQQGETYDIKFEYKQRALEGMMQFDMGIEYPVDFQAIINKAKDADAVVFVGGISPRLEGEQMSVDIDGFMGGDRTSIELPAVQRNLIKALHDAGKKIIFVSLSGSALGLVPESESCDAILQAWYPGQAGGTAVADVLFGDYNPAGRLPVTFYKNVGQLPDFSDYSMKNRTYRYFKGEPLFPFGYGLSYTEFQYGKAKLSTKIFTNQTKKLIVTIPVSNIGKMDGDETVQLYLSRPSDADGPIKTLRGFKREHFKTNETHNVIIELTSDDLLWFDTGTNTMRLLPGKYKLLYGKSSREEDLQELDLTIK